MEVDSYKGKSRMFIGFAIGVVIVLLYLTFTSDPGYYSLSTLAKYCSFGGIVGAVINFALYESSYVSPQELEQENPKNSGSHSSPSYDNYVDTSGGGDSGGGGE